MITLPIPNQFDEYQRILHLHRMFGLPDQDHQFIVIGDNNLTSRLVSLIQDKQLQIKKVSEGRK